jgi:hypothetical protein
MDRFDFYFRQKVSEAELDAAFDAVEQAFVNFVATFGYVGIGKGADATEKGVPNLSVDVSGPAFIYDQAGQLIRFGPTQNVDVSIDEDGVSTAVVTGGWKRRLSVFAKFKRNLSDPRTDGDSNVVQYNRAEGFEFKVVAGAEHATTPVAPALRADQILVCDILLDDGETTILNADIEKTRTQLVYDLTGSPLAIRQRDLQSTLQDMVDEINNLLGANNTWTGAQTFTGDVDFTKAITSDLATAVEPMLTSTKSADDFTGDRRKILELKLDNTDNLYLRMFSDGGTAGRAALLMTINADWSGTQWESDETPNNDAYLLTYSGSVVLRYKQQPTGANWADSAWTNGVGLNPDDGTGLPISFFNDGVEAVASDEVAREHDATIPLFSGTADNSAGWTIDSSTDWVAGGAFDALYFPVPVPDGATIKKIYAMVKPNSASAMTLDLIERTGDWSTPGLIAPTTINAEQDSSSGTSLQKLLLDNSGGGSIGYLVDKDIVGGSNTFKDIRIRIIAAAASDKLHALRVVYDITGFKDH